MIAIDTNILLRYLLADDAGQFSKAKKLIADNSPVLITDVVLVETVWTLMGKRYDFDKETVCEVLFLLIGDGGFIFEDNQVIWSALRDYEESKPVRGKGLDFADALIANKSQYTATQKGLTLSGFYSFDKAVEQLNGARKP